MLFMVRDKLVAAIQEKEGIEIIHAEDMKDMQLKGQDIVSKKGEN